MANQELPAPHHFLKVRVPKYRGATQNYLDLEEQGFRTRNMHKEDPVSGLHMCDLEISTLKLFKGIADLGEGTIGESNNKISEDHHHTNPTHWYILVYVDFYSLVHNLENNLGGSIDLESNIY